MIQSVKSILTILSVITISTVVAYACSHKGVTTSDGIPIFAVGVVLAFVINWIAFVPAFIFQTEKFFDLVGSLSFISVTLVCFLLSPIRDARSIIVLILVLIWALRLGTFLFRRIHRDGKDGRFDDLKKSFFTFLTVWTLQGLWVTLTLASALVIITSTTKLPFDIFAYVGLAIWLIGFTIEVVADSQKSKWRSNPENIGKFINVGLWSKSRHPNYFGEIVIWIGMAFISLPILEGGQYVSLISPLFVIVLLTKISGLPMLENRADEKWGGREDYKNYKENTPILTPKF